MVDFLLGAIYKAWLSLASVTKPMFVWPCFLIPCLPVATSDELWAPILVDLCFHQLFLGSIRILTTNVWSEKIKCICFLIFQIEKTWRKNVRWSETERDLRPIEISPEMEEYQLCRPREDWLKSPGHSVILERPSHISSNLVSIIAVLFCWTCPAHVASSSGRFPHVLHELGIQLLI